MKTKFLILGILTFVLFLASVGSVSAQNQPPIANFTWSPSEPTTADIVQFIDNSTD